MEEIINRFNRSGITFTDEEIQSIDYATFGLNDFKTEGLSLIVYENNEDYCAKEMVLLPNQTCPEHKHPPIGDKAGKKETFRCRQGKVLLYVEGESDETIQATIPEENYEYYTARKEIELLPGMQYTIEPNIKHWFQAGSDGAIISEFSTESLDQFDIFTNPNIVGH